MVGLPVYYRITNGHGGRIGVYSAGGMVRDGKLRNRSILDAAGKHIAIDDGIHGIGTQQGDAALQIYGFKILARQYIYDFSGNSGRKAL